MVLEERAGIQDLHLYRKISWERGGEESGTYGTEEIRRQTCDAQGEVARFEGIINIPGLDFNSKTIYRLPFH